MRVDTVGRNGMLVRARIDAGPHAGAVGEVVGDVAGDESSLDRDLVCAANHAVSGGAISNDIAAARRPGLPGQDDRGDERRCG